MYTYRRYPNHPDQPNQPKSATERNKNTILEGETAKEERAGKKGRGRTPKKNHVNLPASPSEGVGVKGTLGLSRHTRSTGISRDCIDADPFCS